MMARWAAIATRTMTCRAMRRADSRICHVKILPTQEVLSFHRRRREADRLQGPGDAQELRHRDRQDRAESHHGYQVALPAPAGAGREACALPGTAPIHRPALRA